MDAKRALEVLGSSSAASEEALRRAYLKAVRAHAPERDPEGFAEVRAAYELLSALPLRQSILPPAGLETEREVRESSPDRADQAPPSWRTRAPSSPPARPSSAPRAPTPTPANAFARLLVAGDFAAAARSLLQLWAEGSGLAADAVDVLGCTLRLFEARDFGLARELLCGFEAVTERSGMRPSEFDTGLVARWMLVSELSALSGHAADDLIAAFAGAVRSGLYRRAGRLVDRAVAADVSLATRLNCIAPALLAATQRAGSAERANLRPALSAAAEPP